MSIKDFEIIRKLGEGAFAQVFKVQRVTDLKEYAIKSVKFNRLTLKEKENVLTEIHYLATLNSPHVVQYKDSFFDEKTSTLYIVMEYCAGGDLLTKIRSLKTSQFIEEKQIWQYTIQLLYGLKYLHDLQIIHRDFKSANVFLSKDHSQIKIGDLGVAKIASNEFLQTQTGTPYYCSPEVWADKPYTTKSDVWSLGCILYELAQQITPFKASNMQTLFKKVQNGDYMPLNKRYSEDLGKVIAACLQVNPKNRYSINQILEMEEVQKRIKGGTIPQQNLLNQDQIQQEQQALMSKEFKNIAINKDLKKIKGFLPPSKYKDNGFSFSCCVLDDNLINNPEETNLQLKQNISCQNNTLNKQIQQNKQEQVLFKQRMSIVQNNLQKQQIKQVQSEVNLDYYFYKPKNPVKKNNINVNNNNSQGQTNLVKLPPIYNNRSLQKNLI